MLTITQQASEEFDADTGRPFTVPAIGRCACGCEMFLQHCVNDCRRCGLWYDEQGRELEPVDGF